MFPCSTCTSVNFCTGCLSNYLNVLTGQCVIGSACPSATYPNDTSKLCDSCPTGCTVCISLANCSSCNSAIYIFYNYQCLVSCPGGTFQLGVTCQNCSTSCLTCTGSAGNCTLVLAPSVLFSNACQASCPEGYFNS